MKIYNQLKFNSAHVFENTRYCSNKCRLALLLFFLCFSIASFAQVAITGKIVDQESNPIVGATITEKGTQNGTSTDQDGRFRITVKSAESILVLSSVGKKTIELKASSSGLQEITLDSEDKNIDEVLGCWIW